MKLSPSAWVGLVMLAIYVAALSTMGNDCIGVHGLVVMSYDSNSELASFMIVAIRDARRRTSDAVGRDDGSFSSIWWMRSHNARGAVGHSTDSGAASPCRCNDITSTRVRPSNGA